MRRIGPMGSGSSWPNIDAFSVPNGTVDSHDRTGKASEAGARRVMSRSKPSVTSAGHSAWVMTRAISLPSGPNSSHAGANVVGSAGDEDATGVPSCAETVDTKARIMRKGKRTNITALRRGRQRLELETIGHSSEVC